ncbi:MAG: aminoglycoside phosphotransferase family protein [Brevibacillus sp.]|nr:aminoglycoside phosphotransferase family protein [Brevibacillus sp.]
MTAPEMPARYFNRLTYDHANKSVTKRSSDEQKLTDEICWYLDLPARLQHLIPEIYDYSLTPGDIYVTMEYVDQPTLTELFLAVGTTKELLEWEKVFADLYRVVQLFAAYPGRPHIAAYEMMYVTKTEKRLQQFLDTCGWAKPLMARGYQKINGRQLPCPTLVLERERVIMDQLLFGGPFQIIHGDYCFPNILYDRRRRAVKLIDPRGSFGTAGLYGDVLYDLAKVRHSLSGFDHIVRDRFTVNMFQDQIDLSFADNLPQRAVRQLWDSWLGDQLPAVKLIEALLFLSMLPLHCDRPDRQMAMYALGTMLLCNCLYE